MTLLARYIATKFAPTTGTTVLDESGNGRHATLMGGRKLQDIASTNKPGVAGSHAARLNGTADYLAIPNFSALLGTTFSFGGFLRLDLSTPVDPAKTGLVNLGPAGISGATHYPYTDNGLYLSPGRYTDASTPNRWSTTNGTDRSAWHHFMVTNAAGANNYKLWINGVNVQSTTGTTTPYWTGANWTIGRSQDNVPNYFHFAGRMWDIQLHDVALGASAIADIIAAIDVPSSYGGNFNSVSFSPGFSPGFSPAIF